MNKRLPPNWVSKAAPDPSPVEGVDNLPLPMGVNREAVQDAEQRSEATPGAMGQKNGYRECDGDNPKVADSISFANGKDVRSYGSSPSSNATPGKVGA